MKSFFHKAANLVTGGSNGIQGNEMNIGGTTVTIGDKLAEGGYGCVFKANDRYGKQYAVKVLQAPDEEHYQAVLQEFEFQKKLSSHPNIVKVFGIATDTHTRQATILMEFCTGECIKEINQYFEQGFSTQKIVEIFSQACAGVNHMHEQNPPIIHRDLKIENILYNEGKYKVCDFGSATTRVYTLETNEDRNEASDDIQKNTTATYRAPEMCDLYRRQKIDTKCDVWALGGVLYKLCTFKDAFPDGSNLQILNCRYSWPSNRHVDPKLKKIVEMCFETDPAKRPTVREVLGALQKEFPEYVDAKWKTSAAPKASPAPAPKAAAPAPASPKPAAGSNDTFDPFNTSATSSQVSFGGSATSSQATFDPFGNSSPNASPFSSSAHAFPSSPNASPFSSSAQAFPSSPAASPFASGAKAFPSSPTASPFASGAKAFPSSPVSSSPFSSGSVPFAQPAQTLESQSSLIDFNEPSEATSASTEFIEPPGAVVSHSAIDPARMENDKANLIKEILEMPEIEMTSTLFSLNANSPTKAEIFFFSLIHASGTHAKTIIPFIPNLHTPQLQALLESHRNFTKHFPQFEGNFALGVFMQENRAHPPPVGQAPVCPEAVKELLNVISAAIPAVRTIQSKDLAEEAFFAYQITAYLLAKLKQFKINEGYINGTSIPLFTNQHSQLKRAFEKFTEKIPFPADPFDFNSQDFLKRIRPPASRGPQ